MIVDLDEQSVLGELIKILREGVTGYAGNSMSRARNGDLAGAAFEAGQAEHAKQVLDVIEQLITERRKKKDY